MVQRPAVIRHQPKYVCREIESPMHLALTSCLILLNSVGECWEATLDGSGSGSNAQAVEYVLSTAPPGPSVLSSALL
jgi:hypothetical protein